ncbi:hypothetical protein [Nocardiopsis sp. MG754419]|uniref:hypothetical protein n=1 Tax=Nocardiopsis sp. MG754419 TaxID=2259865 RepID=UPI0020130267|nr:hypothetical protein [Nocardiopsis sp. MG754419]
MTHPRRAEAAHRLAAALPELAPTVVVDPRPQAPPSTLRTSLAAWAALHPQATHHLVLQDDAEPCPGMVEALSTLVAARPDDPLSLFCEWGSATATMARWGALGGYGLASCVDRYVPTVGLLLPAGIARELVATVDPAGREDEPDDEALARFLERVGRSALVTVPNLVEHDGDVSLVGNAHRMGVRRSVLLGEKGDPPPSTRVLRAPELIPFVSWRRARAAAVRWDTAHHRHLHHVGRVRASLAETGVAHAVVVEALETWLATEEGRRSEEALGFGLLHELWLTATAVAVWAPLPTADLVAPPSAARRSLSTLATGGLRTVVPQVLTGPGVRTDLDAMLRAAHAAGTAARSTPHG